MKNTLNCIAFLVLLYCLVPVSTFAQTTSPSDPPPYLDLVKAYADAMIEKGRDNYGKQHSPLFASALNRKTMKFDKFPQIEGVREHDRSLSGANMQTDKALFHILYRLTQITGDERYAKEADAAMAFFFKNAQSKKTGLMAWGEHIFWDFNTDKMGGNNKNHEITGSWPFWDQSYRLAPDASWKFAIGQWRNQVADHKTGDFSRHAKWSSRGPGKGADFPRYAGQMIACWADAYQRPENQDRKGRTELIKAITVILGRMEANTKIGKSGYLLAGTDKNHRRISWPGSNLELARTLTVAIPLIDDAALVKRMNALVEKLDVDFHALPHTILKDGGFVATVDSETGKPRSRSTNKPYTTTWASGYGSGTHAGMALRCYERYDQLRDSNSDMANQYKKLIIAAADLYLTSEPDTRTLLKPGTFAEVIELLLNAYKISGEDKKYLERADHIGRLAISLFLDNQSALPKATNQHKHYETITGGPDLMYALLKLSDAYLISPHPDMEIQE